MIKFFELIEFKKLSEEKFREAIKKINPIHITCQLWTNMCKRLLYEKYETFEFTPSSEKVFDGTMQHLSKETGKNIHDEGIVDVSCDSVEGSYYPKNLVDYDKDNLFYSDQKVATIVFDFKDKLITPTAYKLRSSSKQPNHSHLRNWVIEVSQDGNTYYEIDRRDDDSTMNGPNVYATFVVKQKKNDFYRFVRLRQTGVSWSSSSYKNKIGFLNIDFYGKMKVPKDEE